VAGERSWAGGQGGALGGVAAAAPRRGLGGRGFGPAARVCRRLPVGGRRGRRHGCRPRARAVNGGRSGWRVHAGASAGMSANYGLHLWRHRLERWNEEGPPPAYWRHIFSVALATYHWCRYPSRGPCQRIRPPLNNRSGPTAGPSPSQIPLKVECLLVTSTARHAMLNRRHASRGMTAENRWHAVTVTALCASHPRRRASGTTHHRRLRRRKPSRRRRGAR